jgi:hypothetical protein
MNTEEHCGFQFFINDSISIDSLKEFIELAYVYTENLGPVILICTENGYDFMVRNSLDSMYIDIGICDSEDSLWGLLTHLKETKQMSDEDVINNLENCSEKMRSLYNLTVIPKSIKELIDKAILKEEVKNAI